MFKASDVVNLLLSVRMLLYLVLIDLLLQPLLLQACFHALDNMTGNN